MTPLRELYEEFVREKTKNASQSELDCLLHPDVYKRQAVQPAMPTTVIRNRFLYRNRFRAVTLWIKESRDHRGVTLSSRIRLPLFGALGRISLEGASFKEL